MPAPRKPISERDQKIIAMAAEQAPNAQIARALGVTRNVIAGVIFRHSRHENKDNPNPAILAAERLSDNDIVAILEAGSSGSGAGPRYAALANKLRMAPKYLKAVYELVQRETDEAESQTIRKTPHKGRRW